VRKLNDKGFLNFTGYLHAAWSIQVIHSQFTGILLKYGINYLDATSKMYLLHLQSTYCWQI